MLNKLSRKDINLLKQVSNSNASREALNEYLEAHQKAYSAWNVYLGTMKANEVCSEDTEELATEVENIIEYEGEKYKLVERKARVGDVVTFQTRNGRGLEDTQNNKPYKVILAVSGHCQYMDDNSRNMFVHGWLNVKVKTYEKITEQATISNNQFRAEIIQNAKDFVKELRNGGMVVENKHGQYAIDVSFIVNARKKTVVALLRGVSADEIRAKGIAKCHPDDVFNEHIGKAMALGRALGKDVSEFENAVQPDDKVAGMIVKNKDDSVNRIPYVVYKTKPTHRTYKATSWDKQIPFEYHEEGFTSIVGDYETWFYTDNYKIIDDTSAQYQETD